MKLNLITSLNSNKPRNVIEMETIWRSHTSGENKEENVERLESYRTYDS